MLLQLLVLQSRIKNVQVIVLEENFLTEQSMLLLADQPEVHSIILYKAEKQGFYSYYDTNIVFLTISHSENRGPESMDDMVVNIPYYSESNLHNPYFNGKVYIRNNRVEDYLGNSYETIEAFLDAMQDSVWKISKRHIDVCQHCEFRRVCFDGRVPLQRNNTEWYYSTECSYNPYVGKWKGEYGYQSLEELGVISNENEFTKQAIEKGIKN